MPATDATGSPPPAAPALAETLASLVDGQADPAATVGGAPAGAAPVGRDLAVRDPARYHVDGVQGHGGIGWVLRARDLELGRTIALKELIARSAVAEARFEREIRVTARLEHPGIVPLHDAGRWANDGRSFYTMKLVAGATLADTVAKTATLDERLALVPQLLAIAEAVGYAHSRGVIHRDLKPANVVLGEYGETIVIDWGLAKELGTVDPVGAGDDEAARGDGLTMAGAVVGTPAFMAPEQAAGAEVDERADVYSLGAIAYCILTGRAPYHGASSDDVLDRVKRGPPEPLRSREPGIPVDLAAIVDKAMARAPADRYPTGRELALDLRRYQAGRFVEARRHAWWEPLLRWLRRHFVVATLTATFVGLGLAGGAFSLHREQALRLLAEGERGRAQAQTQSLLEEYARRELDAGRPRRAAVYLASAVQNDPGRRVLRSLLAQAAEPARWHVASMPHDRDVVTVAFSPDGARLATGASDKLVRLWTVGSDAPTVLGAHERGLEDLAWSADGGLLAAADQGAVRVWDVAAGTERLALPEGGTSVGLSPDGTQVWWGDRDGWLRIADLTTGRELLTAQVHVDRLCQIVFQGDRAFTLGWDGRIVEWDPARRTRTREITDHLAPMRFLAFSPDGAVAVSGDEEGTVFVRDAHTMRIQHAIRLPSASHATRGWFGADGRTVWTASADGTLRIWHATSGVPLLVVDAVPEGKLFDAAPSPDGRTVAVSSLRSADLWRPAADPSPYRLFEGAEHTMSTFHPAVLSGDGRTFAGARLSNEGVAEIVVWDAQTGAIRRRWREDGAPFGIAIDATGTRLVVALLSGGPPKLVDLATGEVVAALAGHGKLVYNVAVSADGATFATAGYDGTVRQWDAATGAPVGPVISVAPGQRVTAVALDPSGPALAAAIEDGTVALFDRTTGAPIRTFQAHATWIQDVEYDAAGARLLTAGRQDHTAKVWDLARPDAPPVVLTGHTDNLMRGTFSPDGATIATASVDDTARLWDPVTGELLRTWVGPSYTAVFSPDGRTLYTAGVRDYVVAWDLTAEVPDAVGLATDVLAQSPWRLDGGRLVAP